MGIDMKNKYRPKNFRTYVGNAALKKSLGTRVEKGPEETPKVILLHGESGCGKTTVARIIGRAFDIKGLDIKELDNAVYNGKDDVQTLLNDIYSAPMSGSYKMYIMDECHEMSKKAMNSLLKVLEEPPKHVFFILCTTEPNKLITTLRKRCTEYQVKPISKKEAHTFILKIAKKAKMELDIFSESLMDKICDASHKSPRNILGLMEKLVGIDDEFEAAQLVEDTLDENQNVFDLVMLLCKGRGKKGTWGQVTKQLELIKDQDVEGVRRGVLGICNGMFLKNQKCDWTDNIFYVMDAFKDNFFNTARPGLALACYTALYDGDFLSN